MNLQAQTKYKVNDIELNVVITGQGPDVLFIHGFPDSLDVWRKQIEVIAKAGYRVIAPDTRGCGDSQLLDNKKDYHIDNLVADMVGLLDILKVENVSLIAHDWGAVIGWRFALQHSLRVNRYIALSVGHPNCYAKSGIMQKLRGYYILLFQVPVLTEMLLRCCNWSIFSRLTRYNAELPFWIKNLSRPGRLTAALNYYRANLSIVLPKDYPKLEVPVLGIWSSEDAFLIEKQMLDSKEFVSHMQYKRIDGANHWLQLDAPEKLNSILIEYLSTPRALLLQ